MTWVEIQRSQFQQWPPAPQLSLERKKIIYLAELLASVLPLFPHCFFCAGSVSHASLVKPDNDSLSNLVKSLDTWLLFIVVNKHLGLGLIHHSSCDELIIEPFSLSSILKLGCTIAYRTHSSSPPPVKNKCIVFLINGAIQIALNI